ncbi:hypothetical protein Maes01_02226 [Microbulbifer aestuariivivens]|uniref:Dicarboxylate transport domain-containing protein n=1 Tax=Microbulbifer aestuariivivens TaxID=1908308 RepID=A0ABP9WRI1_9GAMM
MPKSSRAAIASVLVILAVVWGVWRDRDAVAMALLNMVQGAVTVEELRGLNLNRRGLHLEQLRLSDKSGNTANGIIADLHQLQLAHPLGFWRTINNSTLSVQQAQITFRKHGLAGQSPSSAKAEHESSALLEQQQSASTTEGVQNGAATKALLLSNLIQSVKRLPNRFEIRQLRWQGVTQDWPAGEAGFLLQREPDSTSFIARYQTQNVLADATLTPANEKLQLRTKLNIGGAPASMVIAVSAEMQADQRWLAALSILSRLQWLQSDELPLPIAHAKGELLLKASGLLPDNLYALTDYKNLWLEVSGREAQVTLHSALLPLTVQLQTPTPLSAQISSLYPLKLQQLSGEAAIDAEMNSSNGAPLSGNNTLYPKILSTNIKTQSSAGEQRLIGEGKVHLAPLLGLLAKTTIAKFLEPFDIEQVDGTLLFAYEAHLPSMAKTHFLASDTPPLIEESFLSLRAGSEISAKIIPAPRFSGIKKIGWEKIFTRIKLNHPINLSSKRWPGELVLSASEIEGTVQQDPEKEDAGIGFLIRDASCVLSRTTTCSTAVSAKSEKLPLAQTGVTLEDINVSSQLQVSYSRLESDIEFGEFLLKAGTVSGSSLQGAGLSITSPSLVCHGGPDRSLCNGSVTTHLESIAFRGHDSAPKLHISGTLSMPVSAMVFERQAGRLTLNAPYQLTHGVLKWGNNGEARFTGSGDLSLVDNLLRGEGKASIGNIPFNGNWMHNFDTSVGTAELQLEGSSFSQSQSLRQSVRGAPVDIVAGSLSAEARFSWPAEKKDRIQLSLHNIVAVYEESFATGINTAIKLSHSGEFWRTEKPQPVSISSMDVGMGITDIHFDLAVSGERDIVLSHLSAKMLGGEVTSNSLRWNLDGTPRQSMVSFSGLSLKALENTMKSDNFAASGTLDLQIPVVTGSEGVTVENGEVEARPPGGRLRYYGAFSPQILAGNPQLKMLSGALEDYSFRTLTGTVNYPPIGDMQLQLKLVGRSDSVAADRDLIINLNLENNIPSMLQSLQASRDLGEALQEKLP